MRTERNHIDLATLIAVLALMVFSLGVVYSASSTWALLKSGSSEKLLGSHALKVLLGFAMIILLTSPDRRSKPRSYRAASYSFQHP